MKILLLLCLLALGMVPNTAKAYTDSVFECDKAKSTSAIQSCLKSHLELSQKRLGLAYSSLDKQFDNEEQRKELKELQQTWLRYRDQECMWEAERATAPGLKNINELSCMVRVSNDRADLLEITYMHIDPEVTRDYADASRWKNLLNNEYTNIIWDIQNAQMVDVTCDGVKEIIVQGIKYNETNMYEIATQPLFEKQEIIAIINNPDIGNVTAEVFAFDVYDEVNEGAVQTLICNSPVKLSFNINSEEHLEDASEKELKNKICESKITVDLNKCENRTIAWDGKRYQLMDREVSNKNKKEKE